MPLFVLLMIALAAPAGAATQATRDALAVQVMLDRAGFSPGVIDGRLNRNTRRALEQYQAEGGDPTAVPADPLTTYVITEQDVTGPFTPDLPSDLMAQSTLTVLAYRSPAEALSERFHTTVEVLQWLNPDATFAEGNEITAPNVDPFLLPPHAGQAGPGPAVADALAPDRPASQVIPPYSARGDVVVTVSKALSSLNVEDTEGRTIFVAPVTTGGEQDPLPIGEWKVEGVQFNPTFHYDPELFSNAQPSHSKAVIPAGPNNPVGVVWIDLSKPHYGLHGTPDPERIGHAESNGCVRLTNWDAVKVARLVKPGTRVVFKE